MTTLTAREKKLIRRVVKALRAEFDVELRQAVRQERDTLLYGLKSLARLNGSGEAVMRFASDDRMTKAVNHSPKGGADIAGRHYPGGQFIPDAELAKATPEEKATLEKKQKEQSGQYGAWGAAAAGEEEKPAEGTTVDGRGRWVAGSDGMVHVYHGTTKANAEKIKAEGLKAPPGTGYNYFMVTSSEDSAKGYTEGKDDGSGPEVLHFAIPAEEANQVLGRAKQHDVYADGGYAAGIPLGTLPAKYLVAGEDKPAEESPSPSTPPAPHTVDSAEALARKLTGANGPDRAETVRQLSEAIGTLSKKEQDELKARLGIRASGNRAEMARKIAERHASTDRTNRQQYVHEKVSVEDAEKRVKDALSDGSLKTPEGRRAVAKLLGEGLTGEELQELKRKLGVKASGSKAEVARKIAERAATNATPKDVAPQPPEEPAVTPTATNGVAPTTPDVAPKQAWEMTAEQYQRSGVPNYGDMVTDGRVAGTLRGASGIGGNRVVIQDGITGQDHYANREDLKTIRRLGVGSAIDDPMNHGEYHKNQVKTALAAGKPVPPEVLADYPDLAPKASPAPHPDDAELYTLNRTPYKQLTKEQRARRDELSRAYSARQYPGSTPFLMGGGKGPGVSDSENESTAGKVASPAKFDGPDAMEAVFDKVKGEKFADKGRVPIHELRAEVRKQFGDEAASAKFDELMHDLRRAGKLRLIPGDSVAGQRHPSWDKISEAPNEQQVKDSIPSPSGRLTMAEWVGSGVDENGLSIPKPSHGPSKPPAAPSTPLSVPELVAKIREIDERNAGRTMSTRDRMDRNDLESAVIQSGVGSLGQVYTPGGRSEAGKGVGVEAEADNEPQVQPEEQRRREVSQRAADRMAAAVSEAGKKAEAEARAKEIPIDPSLNRDALSVARMAAGVRAREARILATDLETMNQYRQMNQEERDSLSSAHRSFFHQMYKKYGNKYGNAADLHPEDAERLASNYRATGSAVPPELLQQNNRANSVTPAPTASTTGMSTPHETTLANVISGQTPYDYQAVSDAVGQIRGPVSQSNMWGNTAALRATAERLGVPGAKTIPYSKLAHEIVSHAREQGTKHANKQYAAKPNLNERVTGTSFTVSSDHPTGDRLGEDGVNLFRHTTEDEARAKAAELAAAGHKNVRVRKKESVAFRKEGQRKDREMTRWSDVPT